MFSSLKIMSGAGGITFVVGHFLQYSFYDDGNCLETRTLNR